MDFYSNLKKIRKQKGYTIREVSHRSGVSTAYISQLENGNRSVPSPEIIKRLSEGLNVSYKDLMMIAGYYEEQEEGGASIEPTPINLRKFIRDNDLIFDGILLNEVDKEWIERMLSVLFWRRKQSPSSSKEDHSN